jgi:glycerol kinase
LDGYILSIDQGTSGSKAIIFNHQGEIIASSFHEVAQYYPHEGWVEQDANEIWIKTLEAVAEVLKTARILPEDIRAIGISNQRCTSVMWNKTTGEPIGRAIIWQDRRTQAICARLSQEDRAQIEKLTGLVTVPNLSCTKILWLVEQDRVVQKAIASDELLFGTIDSWLIWKLSGGSIHVTDRSNACGTGLLNAVTQEYDDWVLKKFKVPPQILPELKSSSEIYGYTEAAVFFGIRVPISGCIGDQPAAVFGQACTKSGMIKNTYGTGSFMILNTGGQHFLPFQGAGTMALWTLGGKTVYGIEGYANVSGAVIQWLRDGLGILGDINEADGLAMQVNDTQGVYFVPALVGLSSPHNSPNARGTIFGINLATTKAHITRAAVESLAYQTRDFLEAIEKMSGIKFFSLRVDGGGAKSDFLMQFQADILGIPVERPAVVEASALGAAYMAGLAVGYWQSVDEVVSLWKLETRFEPRMTSSRRAELYDGWLQAIESAKEWGDRKADNGKKREYDDRLSKLSPREREVIKYFASGMSMRDIAARLYTSLKTVEKQRRDAMRKLGVESQARLIQVCIELNLINQ